MSFKALVDATIHKAVPQVLGEEAVYTVASSSESFSIRGIWSGPHDGIKIGAEGPEYSTTEPSLDVRLSDFDTTPRQGDSVTIFETEYQVIDVQPNGQGLATLVLQLA